MKHNPQLMHFLQGMDTNSDFKGRNLESLGISFETMWDQYELLK